jgi:predicted AAA+ superfamily ATPase
LFETLSSAGGRERLLEAHRCARRFILFFTGETSPVVTAMARLLAILADEEAVGAHEAAAAYRHCFRVLANEAEFRGGEFIGDAWKDHLLDRLLGDDNAFSRKASLTADGVVSPALRAAAAHDLRCLQALFKLQSRDIETAIARRMRRTSADEGIDGFVAWEELEPLSMAAPARSAETLALLRRFAEAPDWSAMVDDLARHFAHSGSGIFHRYRAFRWVEDGRQGRLLGVAHPDPVCLADLVGYEGERALLLRNTEHFLAGSPANNVLLYGDRGTGKSSTIKALLNEYAGRGLRLLEVQKQHLGAFPRILELLRGRREKFILFVDDLSFEQEETFYKELKAVLEGGLEARPANVLLYATSNRRHLVTERFTEREGGDEIHARDVVQEKLSLADRFGITITFYAPDQEGYLAIVESLAQRAGLTLPPEKLRRAALQWAARHNGWSGRTARQFLDFALGEQAAGI